MSGRVLRSAKRKISDSELSVTNNKKVKPAPISPKSPLDSKSKPISKATTATTKLLTKEKSKSIPVTGYDADAAPLALGERSYWLLKAEPESRIVNGHDVKFSIHDLQTLPDQTEHWDGVRNHEAKNNMVKMRTGDLAFFYQSNCKVPGIVGIVEIAREAYVDFTAFDKSHPYYDPKSKEDKPTWKMVDVKFVRETKRNITLTELKEKANAGPDSPLNNFALVRRARLSVIGVTHKEWDYILLLESQQSENN